MKVSNKLRKFAVILSAMCLCITYTGCETEGENADGSIDTISSQGESVINDSFTTKTEILDDIEYTISGNLSTAAVFDGGPHHYTFEHVNVDMETVYGYDTTDKAVIEKLIDEELIDTNAANGFVRTDIEFEDVDLTSIERKGVIAKFSETNDTEMTIHHKILFFDGQSDDCTIIADCNSFYDDADKVIGEKILELTTTLKVLEVTAY